MDRLSVLDTQFLHLEDASSPMHIASLSLFDGPAPRRDEVLGLLAARLPLMPRYRKRLRFPPLELGRPVWADDTHFDLGYHVRQTALPAPGDDAALCTLMGRLMSQLLDRSRPLWEIWIVEGLAGARWAMITKVHHSMVDGIGGVQLQEVMLEDLPDKAPQKEAPPAALSEPSRLGLVLDAWQGLAKDAGAVAGRALRNLRHPKTGARALLHTAGGLTFFARRLAAVRSGPTQGPIGGQRSFAHASVSLADVQAVRKAFGGSVNDVVLAAISGGYRQLFQHRHADPDHARLRSLVPVSVRGPDRKGDLHNHISAMVCDLPLDIADPLERLRVVTARMGELKASHMAEAGVLIIEIGELLPPMVVGPVTRFIARAMHAVPQRALATVTTNVPGPREPLYLLGRRLLSWYPYVPIAQGLRIGVAILSYAGELAFGVTGDRDTVPDAGVLARAIVDDIRTMVAMIDVRESGRPRAMDHPQSHG